jgi:hypothetical protein
LCQVFVALFTYVHAKIGENTTRIAAFIYFNSFGSVTNKGRIGWFREKMITFAAIHEKT